MNINLYEKYDIQRLNEVINCSNFPWDGTEDQSWKENMIKQIYISDEINNLFDDIDLNKCEKIVIPSIYINKIGINAIGVKWY